MGGRVTQNLRSRFDGRLFLSATQSCSCIGEVAETGLHSIPAALSAAHFPQRGHTLAAVFQTVSLPVVPSFAFAVTFLPNRGGGYLASFGNVH